MNTSRSANFIRLLIATLFVTIGSETAFGQARQYQRRSSKPSPVVTQPTAPSSDGKANAPVAAAPEAAPGEKKVDVSDLEKKYWVPKDTEFQVVQNRTYTKAKRFALNVSYATMINDFYSSGGIYGLTANYYFSERQGVQLQYLRFDSQDASSVSEFRNTFRVIPDFNRIKAYYGASFNWVPIYAKLSLLEQQIIYFDLSVSPGLGMTEYDQSYLYEPSTKMTAPTFALDFAQHFYLNQHLAIRFDFMNRLFNEEVRNARIPSEVKRTKLNHTMIIQGGITFHF